MEMSSLTLTDLPGLTDLIIGSDENCNNSYSFYCCKKLEVCNLPSLQTLEFGLFSFFLTTSLHLASILVSFSFSSDLPNLISLSFSDASFSKLQTLSWLGLSHIASISIGNRCMEKLSEMEFADFPNLEHITFGTDCCRNTKKLQMRNLDSLRGISVGDRSFYKTAQADFYELRNVSSFTIGKRVFPALLNVKMECVWVWVLLICRCVRYTSLRANECL